MAARKKTTTPGTAPRTATHTPAPRRLPCPPSRRKRRRCGR